MKHAVRSITIEKQNWPLEKEFRIARGARTQTEVIVVSIVEGQLQGRGESVPTARYGESMQSVIDQIRSIEIEIAQGMSIEDLNQMLPAGAARNAVDCALWDLKAKQQKKSVAAMANLKEFSGCETAQTLSIGSVKEMANAAALLKEYPLIKIKFDCQQVIEKMHAISKAAPNSRFIIDANEAWNIKQLNTFSETFAQCNVALIEQPLTEKTDTDLINYQGTIPLCADESIHTRKEFERVSKLYQYINIKLDKTGGFSEAHKLLKAANEKNIGIMVGCMVATSLAMAPAALLASYADFVDLDGPALLLKDRKQGFGYHKGIMHVAASNLWGY